MKLMIRFIIKDIKSSNPYSLICYKSDINIRKRKFFDEHECAGGGYYMIYDVVDIILGSNFPKDNEIWFYYISREEENLHIGFVLGMVFTYDHLNNRILPKMNTAASIDFFNKILINGKEYNDVHLIKQEMFYDSIFYNSEFGFLRLVSTEGNLDIVLDNNYSGKEGFKPLI